MSLLKLSKAKYLHVGDIILPYNSELDVFVNTPCYVYCIDERLVYVRSAINDDVHAISKTENVLTYV